MFGLGNLNKPLVHKYQFVVYPNFETSVEEFYELIEADLNAKRLEGLSVSRVEYAEGGLLSANRVYLRMQRERLVFDVCGAPFGTAWFFSYRFSEIPRSPRVVTLIALLVLLAGVAVGYMALFGWLVGSALFALSVLGIAILMRNALVLGLRNLDAFLLRSPLLGDLYESFRKETYYREDTRAAYLKIVEDIIQEKIGEVTAAKGLKLIKFLPGNSGAVPAGIARVLKALFRLAR